MVDVKKKYTYFLILLNEVGKKKGSLGYELWVLSDEFRRVNIGGDNGVVTVLQGYCKGIVRTRHEPVKDRGTMTIGIIHVRNRVVRE